MEITLLSSNDCQTGFDLSGYRTPCGLCSHALCSIVLQDKVWCHHSQTVRVKRSVSHHKNVLNCRISFVFRNLFFHPIIRNYTFHSCSSTSYCRCLCSITTKANVSIRESISHSIIWTVRDIYLDLQACICAMYFIQVSVVPATGVSC